jgi:hypothetical protein
VYCDVVILVLFICDIICQDFSISFFSIYLENQESQENQEKQENQENQEKQYFKWV